ncbi:MAG: SIS domain-containing protein [Candidatus Heimdallarchaeota archaeon]
MLRNLEDWPIYSKKALNVPIDLPNFPKIMNVVILGMGTPNAVGRIFELWSRIPLMAIDDWSPPPWVGEETLVLALSYSGNTREVLTTTEKSFKRGGNIIAISSGGKLKDLGSKKGFATINFDPVGRSANSFPYLFLLSGRILDLLGLLHFHTDSKSLIEALKAIQARQDWVDIAEQLSKCRQLVVCGSQNTRGLVTWIKHCFNETAKKLVIPLILPEASHGEVEAFTELDSNDGVIFLREGSTETELITKSFKLYKELLANQRSFIIELKTEAPYRVNNILSLAFQGILISFWLALFRKIDPAPLPIIDMLKNSLEKPASGIH